jgi:hypothetical protein
LAVRSRTGKANEIREGPGEGRGMTESLRLYDTRTGKPRPFFEPKPSAAEVALFSPDGRLFVTTELDGSIHDWEIATGTERMQLKGHLPGEITSLTFSLDGRVLVSGGADTQVFLWDMTGRSSDGTWRTVKHAPERQKELWDALTADAPTAQRAIWELAADPAGTVEWIAQRVRPTPVPEPATMAHHIAELDAVKFADRERAMAVLRDLGETLLPTFRDALKQSSSAEHRKRLETLIRELEEGIPLGNRLRELRALEILEHIGSPEAKRLLNDLTERRPSPMR